MYVINISVAVNAQDTHSRSGLTNEAPRPHFLFLLIKFY